MKAGNKGRKKWRAWLAYGVVFLTVSLLLFNFVTDAMVTRYDATEPRDQSTGLLAGMVPRSLGPVGSQHAVLFVHGFSGAQSNFATLPDAAAEAGWYVETMRLPGHGTSPRDFERITGDELVEGVRDAIVSLKARYTTVIVVSHSMGGALATLAVAQEPVDGLVLCAPYFGLTWNRILGVPTGWLAQRIAPVIRWIPGRPGNGPVAKPEGRKHIQCYGWIPMAAALTALEISNRANAPDVLEAINMPVLAIHSAGDSVTAKAATEKAIGGMTNAQVQSLWLTRSDHVIFWDYDAVAVQERIIEFLREAETR